MIQISNIKVKLDEDKDEIIKKFINKNIRRKVDYKIVRESIDARKEIVFNYIIEVDASEKDLLNKKIDYKLVENDESAKVLKGDIELLKRPVIIGFGPAGIFAALELAKNGYRPIVFEQGNDVDKRSEDVNLFWEKGILNPNSNVQFGEGGAGTFSDGKLTTRIKEKKAKYVLEVLNKFGGSDEILYTHKPHIGTDVLIDVIKNIRKEILKLGGNIYFGKKLNKINIENGRIKSIIVNDETIDTDVLVLAIGHSSRDVFRLLKENDVNIEKKSFAVGFRIEHPQIVIDKAQFKENYDHPKLKSAEYHLTYTAKTNRSCYTFCMCPGGRVIASASEKNQVVVNGMSYNARDLENANSAILCSVNANDFGEDVLAGMKFQEEIERKAFVLGGENYNAPVQKVGDYLRKKETTNLGSVVPSYKPGIKFARLDKIYPEFIYETIADGIIGMGKKLKGFDMEDAILIGVETRTSSPIRIVRDKETLESTNVVNLFPCGEGAGYAGGIVSAGVDGIKVANAIIKKFTNSKLE